MWNVCRNVDYRRPSVQTTGRIDPGKRKATPTMARKYQERYVGNGLSVKLAKNSTITSLRRLRPT